MRLGVAAVAVSLAIAAEITQAQTFSSRVDAVRVDVLVTEGGRLIRGLTRDDFEILDNGVAQRIDLVTFERLPLNVVLALDMSDSVAGDRLEQLREAGGAILERLAPDDEAGLVTFGHAVTIRAPLSGDRGRVRAALRDALGWGRTSLVDAAHTGLMVAETGVGRSLLIVFSDGVDTASWLTPEVVLDTARRTDVVAYCVSTRDDEPTAFTESLASLTGGSRVELRSMKELGATFVRILEEFRQRYLVSYTPRGVSKDGWHRLDVRLKGRRGSVRARPGYLAGD
jgi:VWFA-related protein